MTDPSVSGLVPKPAADLVVGDRIPESQLIYKFNKGPAEVVFLADEPEDSHTFIAYRYPNRRHESMTVRSEAVLDVYPADTGLSYSRADDGETTQPIAGRVPPHFGAVVNEGGHTAVQVAGGLIEIDPPEDPVCPVCRSRYSKHNALGLRLHGLAPANEYDESLDALAPCQPIGCDNGHHVPGCFYAKDDA